VVVSPHLDDAVLGCGRLLAAHPGSTVVTVFAGRPERYPEPMRQWDVQSGFESGDDVMAARRAEDTAALTVLGAQARHLDFVEYSYNADDRPIPPAEIAPALHDAIASLRPTVVVAPFGLANPDHDVTHDACMAVRAELVDDVAWWCYEDTGYKHIPGLLAWRVSSLFRGGSWPTPVCPPVAPDDARKQRALACYPSQLRALEEDWHLSAKLAAPAPEQYWRLAPPPAGWEGLSER
jgi:LmbE family N-acetylglucosaminyl deacetylase